MNLITSFLFILFISVSFCHVHKHVRSEKSTVSSFEKYENDAKFDSEALFGTKSSDLNDLSHEEIKNNLKKLILNNKIDLNNDNFIDLNELTEWVAKSFKSLVIEDSLEQFLEEDLNNDGKISWEEYLDDNFNIDSKEKSEQEMISEDLIFWKKADLNHDGFLDKNEFPSFITPEDFPLMYDTLYEVTMKKRDLDKDSFLNLNEYLMNDKGELPDINTENYIIDKEKFENDLDLNKNNLLEKNEVLLWIIPNNTEIALDEAKHLIQSCDDNRDGKLTIDEIINNHEHFMSSESTDYGEKLKNIEHDEL